MGRPHPDLIGAAFAYFPMPMVSKIVSRAWDAGVTPEKALAVGIPGLATAARAVFGEGEAVQALAPLLEEAVSAARIEGRSLATAWRTVTWPDEPAARMLAAATVLREHRGDGHIFGLAARGLSPLQGNLLAAGMRSEQIGADAKGRGWRDDDLAPAVADLEQRGAVAGGELTDVGRALWEAAEAATDEFAAQPWQGRTDRLRTAIELSERVLESSAW